MTSLIDKIAGAPWAIAPDALQTILDVARRESRIAREDWPVYAADARAASDGYRRATVQDGIALLPITGPIFPKANLLTDYSGGTSLDLAERDLDTALRDTKVEAIVLDIASPGGSAFGIDRFATALRAAEKPVVAPTGEQAASAAYWIGSAASRIVAEPTAMLGSIGVVQAVAKQVQPDAWGEITFEIVSSGAPQKRADPRTESGFAALQTPLNDLEAQFVAAVAQGRRTTAERVLAEFGRGGMLIAGRAKAAGMIDQLGTLADAMALARDLARAATPSSPAALDRAALAGVSDSGPVATAHQGDPAMSTPTAAGGQPAATPVSPAAPAPAAAPDLAAIRAEAAQAERARIASIQAATIPGHEALAQQAIESGQTAEQFALAQSLAERNRGTQAIEERRRAIAAQPATPHAPAPAANPAADALPESDDAAGAQYDGDPALRAEFSERADYVAYVAAAREKKVAFLRDRRAA
jgi:ClpP class serine protease